MFCSSLHASYLLNKTSVIQACSTLFSNYLTHCHVFVPCDEAEAPLFPTWDS